MVVDLFESVVDDALLRWSVNSSGVFNKAVAEALPLGPTRPVGSDVLLDGDAKGLI